jgi:hypothetical protein
VPKTPRPRLTEQQVCAVEDATQRGRYPERDLLLVRLAWRAGLDDHMLARLPSSAFESSGQTASDRLQLPAARGEVGAGRAIPICPAVREAHAAFVARFPNADFVAFSDRQRRETTGSMSPQTIRLRLLRLQLDAGLGRLDAANPRRPAAREWRSPSRRRALAMIAARQQRHAATMARQQSRRPSSRRMTRGPITVTA